MSFSGKVKEELAGRCDTAKHCRIAQLSAMAFFCGHISKEGFLFKSENDLCPAAFEELLRKTLDCSDNDIKIDGHILSVSRSLSEAMYMTLKWKSAQQQEVCERVDMRLLKNECCKKAFLRGAFLCAGSVNDPSGAYHFEIACKNKEISELISDIMRFFSLDVKLIERKKKYIVYLKEGEAVTDALNLMGACIAQMDFFNAMIYKDMRNSVNRRVNCETANLNKTVSAAVRQIKDIEFIKETVGLEALNEQLKEIAMLRLANTEASLKDLGEMINPPLGRSGVNHRLKAIEEFATNLRNSLKFAK